MQIEIVGAESLGVRSLCCLVKTRDRQIVIDPGVALGYQRKRLLPHPVQVAAGENIREAIINALKSATDVVISHFHGDHIPLPDANPYQLKLERVAEFFQTSRLWTKGIHGESHRFQERRNVLLACLKKELLPCEGQTHGPLSFSKPVPHGLRGNKMGTVMMTRIEDKTGVFVHASDIQLLDDEPVRQVVDWNPTVLLVSGPALYRNVSRDDLAKANRRAKALVERVDICIIDHHLLRCEDGVRWLDTLKTETEGRIVCAADFMKKDRRFLEARRAELYNQIPVPQGWHESYAGRLVGTSAFRTVKAQHEAGIQRE